MEHVFFALALIAGVFAVAPPHPDFAEEYWRRGGRLPKSSSNSSSNNLGCAILYNESCNQLSSLSRSAESNLNILKQSNELHSLVLLVRFTDHIDRILPTRDDLDLLWNSNDISEVLPTGSIHRYIYLNSYNRFNLKATVIDWLPSDDTELHYSFDESGLNTEIAAAAYPALEALDHEGYDFSVHDSDGDMNIDSLVFLHSGYSAENGEKDCYNDREPEQRIWSHASSHASKWKSKDGYSFDFYLIASSMRGACGSERANIGVITHELIHSWGLPDLYDTGSVGKGTGHYDIMSGPYGWDGMQTHPFYMSPWTRMKSGFLEPIEIEYDGYYPVAASALASQIYIIRANFPEGEYLMIENRQPLDYDAQMKGSGILIWHIDDRQDL